MFTFDLKGMEQTLQDLENLFSARALLEIKDNALKEGSEFMQKKLHAAQLLTKDSGTMASELTFSDPRWDGTERVISIHWKGDNERYRVVHLVENGFYAKDGSFVKPAAYGQIESILASNRAAYIEIIKRSIARQIGA